MGDSENIFGRSYDKTGPVSQAEEWLDYSTGRVASNKKIARPRSSAWTKTVFPKFENEKRRSYDNPKEFLSVEEWSQTHPKSLHPGFLTYAEQNAWLHATLCLDGVQRDLDIFNKETARYQFMKIPVCAEDIVKSAGDQLDAMRNGGWWKDGVRLGVAAIRGVFLEIRHDEKMQKMKKPEQAQAPFLIHRFWPLLYEATTDVLAIPYDSE